MQIKLTPADVNTALIAHLRHKGMIFDESQVSFTYFNRRTKGGIYAEVNIGMPAPSTAPTTASVADPVVAPTQAVETPVEASITPTDTSSLFG